jgi:hypothetical protein
MKRLYIKIAKRGIKMKPGYKEAYKNEKLKIELTPEQIDIIFEWNESHCDEGREDNIEVSDILVEAYESWEYHYLGG